MPRYELYGLAIDCAFQLPAPVAAETRADLTVEWGEERPVPVDPPAGIILSQVSVGPLNYSATRTEDGYVIRYPGSCDAVVDEDLATVVLHAASSEKRAIAELLFVGNVLAKIMTLRGECVLHASAVAVEGRAIAYIGPPGRGKSTLAALTCAAGARLVTDDVLRLIPGEDAWWSPTGTGVVRLRPQAESIKSLLDGPSHATHDQRIGVTLNVDQARFPVAALVFPLPSRTTEVVEVARLSENDALMRLTSFPRVLGWKDPEVLARSFRANARLAREIRAYEAVVPWGPPFDLSVAVDLVRLLEEDAQRTA